MERCHYYIILFALLFQLSKGQFSYQVPDVTFEAFSPKGLRVSIPATPGVQLFGFHGKINKPLFQTEPGEFYQDIKKSANGKFAYFNPSLQLNIGDKVNYWVFVQHDEMGYRKDDQSWQVDKLVPFSSLNTSPTQCTTKPSISQVLDKTNLCAEDVILDARFNQDSIDENTWLIEQYYADAPDYEYVIYRNDPDVLQIYDNMLHIKPKVNESIVKSNVVIEGCTRKKKEECERKVGIYQHPIVSGRLVSKVQFAFGKVVIRAKLPQGDWLFPELYLEDVNNPFRRILIGYARGNEQLIGYNNDDIGSRLLFGGPVISTKEPALSRYLSTHRETQPLYNQMHSFILIWNKRQIQLLIDDIIYGVVDYAKLKETGFDKETMVHLVIGVGAGGPIHFPDYYRSGNYTKPWSSKSRSQVKEFFDQRSTWLPTWNSNSQLQIESVKITAL